MAPIVKKDNKAKKASTKFSLDCTDLVNDGIFDSASFEKFLHDRIKVNNRTGNIADVVTIARAGTGAITLTIAPGTPFSKRYLKYLTKKFLKKEQLREYVRVVSTKKDAYILKYFNIEEDGADDDEE